jgi:hypothetical protein
MRRGGDERMLARVGNFQAYTDRRRLLNMLIRPEIGYSDGRCFRALGKGFLAHSLDWLHSSESLRMERDTPFAWLSSLKFMF